MSDQPSEVKRYRLWKAHSGGVFVRPVDDIPSFGEPIDLSQIIPHVTPQPAPAEPQCAKDKDSEDDFNKKSKAEPQQAAKQAAKASEKYPGITTGEAALRSSLKAADEYAGQLRMQLESAEQERGELRTEVERLKGDKARLQVVYEQELKQSVQWHGEVNRLTEEISKRCVSNE